MNEFDNRSRATPDCFNAVSMAELNQIEGGLSWKGFKELVKVVANKIKDVLNPPGNPIPPIK